MKALNVKEIVKKYLKENNYPGLHDGDECYCELENLLACDEAPCDCETCEVAYKVEPKSKECDYCQENNMCVHVSYNESMDPACHEKHCSEGCLRPLDERDLNMCDTCENASSECPAKFEDILWGSQSNNVISCQKHKERP